MAVHRSAPCSPYVHAARPTNPAHTHGVSPKEREMKLRRRTKQNALTEVVRDDDDTALVLFNRARERVNRRHVQVVRRLVQQQDVWVLHRQLREHDPTRAPGKQKHASRQLSCHVMLLTSRNTPEREPPTYRFRSPSESCLIGEVWWAPDRPKRPSCARHAWMSLSGNFSE